MEEHSSSAAKLAKIERMVARLRDVHEIGRQAQALARALKANELADRFKIDATMLRKFRRFSMAYSQAELNDLCLLRRPNGLPLQFQHVVYLMSLKDKTKRPHYQIDAAAKGWTAPMLLREVIKETNNLNRHGRPMKCHADLAEDVQQLRDQGRMLVRRSDVTLKRVKSEAKARLDEMSERQFLADAVATFDELIAQFQSVKGNLEILIARASA